MIGIAIGIVIVLFKKRDYKYCISWIIIIFAFVCGSILYSYQQQRYEAFYSFVENNHIDLIGIVTHVTKISHSSAKFNITLDIKNIKRHNNQHWQAINTAICIYIPYKPHIQVSDTIEIKDIAFKKISNQSFRNYLVKEGIGATLFVTKFNYALINRPAFSIQRWLFNKKESLLNVLQTKMSSQTFHLFSSIFLGNKNNKKDIENSLEQFKTWGIMHHLARSGLHLIVFILVWQTILNVIPLTFAYKQLFLIVLSIVYFILSWPSTSFNRAFGTFILYKTYPLFNIQANFLHVLTIICFLTLALNPIQLFFLDFQLSFGLAFALAWLHQLKAQTRHQ